MGETVIDINTLSSDQLRVLCKYFDLQVESGTTRAQLIILLEDYLPEKYNSLLKEKIDEMKGNQNETLLSV